MALRSACPAIFQLDVADVGVFAITPFLTTSLFAVVVVKLADFHMGTSFVGEFACFEGRNPRLVFGLVGDLTPPWVFLPVDC